MKTPPRITLDVTLNGAPRTVEAGINETLFDLLRRIGHVGVKNGCLTGDCGACAIELNGRPILSCCILAAHAQGSEIVTPEGLGRPDALDPLQEAFLDTGAVQCGYCTPGMLIAARHLLRTTPDPSDAEIRDALAGNLCRCTGYVKPVEAVRLAAKRQRRRGKRK